jgi:hypothetical protein
VTETRLKGQIISYHMLRRTARAKVQLIHDLQAKLERFELSHPEREATKARLHAMGVSPYNTRLVVQKAKRGPFGWYVKQLVANLEVVDLEKPTTGGSGTGVNL